MISELVAGRELDALIAERVMGWHDWHGEDRSGLIGGTWSPSYDINAAWQVITLLTSRGVGLSVSYAVFTGEWTATFGGLSASADTAPLAICHAALDALVD